jgi:hypothetical protein
MEVATRWRIADGMSREATARMRGLWTIDLMSIMIFLCLACRTSNEEEFPNYSSAARFDLPRLH